VTVAYTTSRGVTSEHCVVRVIDQKASGELTVSLPRCYRTFEQAMQAENVVAWGAGASTRAVESNVTAATFTLAVHYDYSNLNPAGGSTSTIGSDCNGGWLNVSSAWNNRISSTLNGCPFVVHRDGYNLTGDSYTTTGGGGNLGTMNNRTSSIQYT
jgi:hypothetical protein